tara:strand:- start:329 stop:775 length:447 start_codon:yes stop_codon:yes gene_type:complete
MNVPYHPLLIHLPIGFIFAALIMHCIYLFRANWTRRIVSIWLTGFAALFSLLASISGQIEYQKALSKDYSSQVINILETHKLMGNILTWVLIVFTVIWVNVYFKKMVDRRIDIIAFIVLLSITIGITITSYFGGTLVWEYGVGIKSAI